MRIALVANPASGTADPDEVASLLRDHGAEVSRFEPGEVDAAIATAPDRIVLASGDGNVARTAHAAGRAGIELAVVPSGTGNDFARAMGIPDDRQAACRLAATGTTTRHVDLAWCDDHPFVNVASLGLSVVALRRAEGIKSTLGAVGYPLAALSAAITAGAAGYRIEVDGELVHEGTAWQVLVADSGAFGGGATIDAAPDDARLQVVVLERGPRLRLARHAWGLRSGDLGDQPGVRCARGRTATIHLLDGSSRGRARRNEINCDGDLQRVGEVVAFRVDGRAFELVVPPPG